MSETRKVAAWVLAMFLVVVASRWVPGPVPAIALLVTIGGLAFALYRRMR